MTSNFSAVLPKTKAAKTSSKKVRIISWIVLIFMALIMLLPLFILFNVSLKSIEEFGANPMSIFQIKSFTLLFANYAQAFDTLDIFSRLLYTVLMTVGSSLIACVVVTLAAYPISRKHFKGTNGVFVFILASTFFPGSLVANIFLVQTLGLYNNPLVLIMFWGLGGLTVYIFMAIQFLYAVPKDLDEAAFIDGCSYFRYIVRVIIPLMKPILVTIFVLKLVGAWNDFLTPYIYLVEDKFMTISTGLYAFKGQFANNWPGLAAATLTVATPVVILYVFLQRFIIEGMAAGAIKG